MRFASAEAGVVLDQGERASLGRSAKECVKKCEEVRRSAKECEGVRQKVRTATVFYGGVIRSYLFGGTRDGKLRIRY